MVAQDKPAAFPELNTGSQTTEEAPGKGLSALRETQVTTAYAGAAAASSTVPQAAGAETPGLEKSLDGDARMMNYARAVIKQGEEPGADQQTPPVLVQLTMPLGAASQIRVVQDKNSVMRKLIQR